MKRRILFVDDERNVLDGLRRMLRSMRNEWEMAFVESGKGALELLAGKSFDMIVVDMRMPGMDGLQLLKEVRDRHPHMVRIILSGYADQEMTMQSVRVAHQLLSKPCDSEVLKTTLARAFALRDILRDESLLRVVSHIESLPAMPSVYMEVLEELNSPSASAHKVAGVISKDLGIAAKILQVANSAFFGIHSPINSLDRAMLLLGFETVAALVATVQVFSIQGMGSATGFSISALWSHSMRTGVLAKAIAVAEKQSQGVVDESFTAGLLHDVGRLVLAVSIPETYGRCIALACGTGRSIVDAEREIIGATHADVGAYLMGLWGLPDAIVEAIAFHHSPQDCMAPSFCPLTAVHAANCLAGDAGASCGGPIASEWIDRELLAALGLSDRLPVWEAVAAKILEQGAANG
jgi:HD-like signal output (HDOD) protein/CheY-like chemotaxis protein